MTFQPIQAAGRLEHFDPATDRLTLTEVRRRILEQTTLFRPEDVIPVPCHPDSLAMAYALKIGGERRAADRPDRSAKCSSRAGATRSSSSRTTRVRDGVFKLFATNHSPSRARRACATCCAACRGWTRRRTSATATSSACSIMQFIDALFVRRALGEEDLRPHRAPRRAADSVRHLQPVLPGRPGAVAPRAAEAVGGTFDAEGDVMRRVLAVVLIATLTTMMIGIDATSWASQDRDQEQAGEAAGGGHEDARRDASRHTATIERQDGEKIDVVIEEITPDASSSCASSAITW